MLLYIKKGKTGRIFMRRLKGFTLTELMVAMAVIGILVAVVTPAIMKTRPNKNKMMIKKSFYTTEQIVSTLINDERLYPDMREVCDSDVDVAESESANIYCAYGFDYTNEKVFEGETYSGTTKFAHLFASRLNVKRTADNEVYYTSDGVKWDLHDAVGKWTPVNAPSFDNNNNAEILIDVNGDADPNCREGDEGCSADDFDQYVVQILATGKLRIDPDDAKAVDYATINTSIKDN